MSDSENRYNHYGLWVAARVLSIASHPMLVPIYTMLMMLYLSNSPWYSLPGNYKSGVLLFVSLGTTLLPLVWMGVCLLLRIITDIEMPNKTERFWPLLLSCLTSFTTGILGNSLIQLPSVIRGMVFGVALLLLVAVIITPKWKISLHSLGLGALLAFVTIIGTRMSIDFGEGLYIILVLSGLVGWSRLYLIAHTPLQLLIGYIVGFICMAITLLIF